MHTLSPIVRDNNLLRAFSRRLPKRDQLNIAEDRARCTYPKWKTAAFTERCFSLVNYLWSRLFSVVYAWLARQGVCFSVGKVDSFTTRISLGARHSQIKIGRNLGVIWKEHQPFFVCQRLGRAEPQIRATPPRPPIGLQSED